MKEKIGIWNTIVSAQSMLISGIKVRRPFIVTFICILYIPHYNIMSRKCFCESNIRAV